ncbi:hypothetical protein ACROYT_G016585 [Oculina patagonica]
MVTHNNHVLVGHVFRQLFAKDWLNCIQACHDEPRCISYNYEKKLAGANGLCELNDCGVEDLCDCDKSLIYTVGSVFQQIRGSKAPPSPAITQAPPQRVTTQAPPQPTGFVSCANDGDGTYPDPSDCSKFIECQAGVEYTKSCGQYQMFNPKIKTCDWPKNVDCP